MIILRYCVRSVDISKRRGSGCGYFDILCSADGYLKIIGLWRGIPSNFVLSRWIFWTHWVCHSKFREFLRHLLRNLLLLWLLKSKSPHAVWNSTQTIERAIKNETVWLWRSLEHYPQSYMDFSQINSNFFQYWPHCQNFQYLPTFIWIYSYF